MILCEIYTWRSLIVISFFIAARCSRGQEISLANTLLCVDCDYGFYQMAEEPIGERCIGCPGGQSTVARASTSPNDCKGRKNTTSII